MRNNYGVSLSGEGEGNKGGGGGGGDVGDDAIEIAGGD